MDSSELERELRDLARRVAEIEQHLSLGGAAQPRLETPGPVSAPATPTFSDFLPALGRALLGLAGAYLLRALTESSTLPVRAGVLVGILYAIFWLVWAARTPADRRVEAALHSLTAVLVLAPLLWEATLRFQAVPPFAAGLVLLFFTVFGLAVSWRKNLLIVATIATLAGLATTAALLVATRDVLPFTFVFLAIAAAVEGSACLDHWLSERWLAAIAANLSVLLATWLVTNGRGLPEGYAPIPHAWLGAAQVALLAIYLISTIVRTLLRRFTFTFFETAQCALAFAISVGGGLRLSPAMPVVAVVCGGACYAVAFAMRLRGRNFYTYSTFAILLVLAGSRMLLSAPAAVVLCAVLAIGCAWSGRLTLGFHGAVYLLIGLAQAFTSGLPMVLAGGTLVAAICFWPAVRSKNTVLRTTMAAILAALTTTLIASVLPPPLRTDVLPLAALLLARLRFPQLAYPAMAAGAYRLLMIDLSADQKPALFLALLIYGAALILLPRLRRSQLPASPSLPDTLPTTQPDTTAAP
jgi:hypothetical protein